MVQVRHYSGNTYGVVTAAGDPVLCGEGSKQYCDAIARMWSMFEHLHVDCKIIAVLSDPRRFTGDRRDRFEARAKDPAGRTTTPCVIGWLDDVPMLDWDGFPDPDYCDEDGEAVYSLTLGEAKMLETWLTRLNERGAAVDVLEIIAGAV